MITSNRFFATTDLANRSIFTRIQKRDPNLRFKVYPGNRDLLEHIFFGFREVDCRHAEVDHLLGCEWALRIGQNVR